MAGSETSLNSYTFTYKWKVSDLETRLYGPNKLSSPKFSSPSGTKPATAWMLTIFSGNEDTDRGCDTDCTPTPPPPVGEKCLSVELKRLVSGLSTLGGPPVPVALHVGGGGLRPIAQQGAGGVRPGQSYTKNDDRVWVKARLKSQSSSFENLTEFGVMSVSQGPTKLGIFKPGSSSDGDGPSAITFKCFLPLSKVQDSQSITFECEIKIRPKEPSSKSNFSLSKFIEEARQNYLFTDVTLVADGKEFEAHKVVLASQSQFFKTRFSGRWVSPSAVDTSDERVEMTDVPVVAMEAILSYVYTGKVIDIGKIAYQLLPIAEEYGVLGLRKMCEENLIQSLTSTTVINMLIHAASHNAPDLKKACIQFIVYNTAAVRQSESWGKLKKDQTHHDLWVELLENIVEITT